MSWVVDNANTIYLLLGIVLLVFVAWFWVSKRVKHLGVAAAVLVVIGLFWLLTRVVVTDRRQIEANVHAMAAAAEVGDVDGLFKHLAPKLRVQRQEVDREALRGRVKAVLQGLRINHVQIANFEIEEVTRDGEKGMAKATFRARPDNPEGTLGMTLCVTEFVRDGGQWKLRAVEFRQPIANTDQLMPVPLP